MDCIFCKIAKGELPCYKIYEDENFLAFLDIRPLNLGHTLVIPKKHYRWVWDVLNIGDYYEVVAKIANAIKKALHTDLVISMVVGEEVAHAHVWLVPRFSNDGHGSVLNFENIKEFTEREMQDVTERVKNNL